MEFLNKDSISLVVNGQAYDEAWDNIRVTRSLDMLCASFEFTTTQKQPYEMANWPIKMGNECSVYVGETLAVTGYIEDINISYDKDSHTVQVAGRDKTADLVDCTRGKKDYAVKGISIADIIKRLLAPHDIKLIIDSSVTALANKVPAAFTTFDTGDPLVVLILKLTKREGILPVVTPEGALMLTATGIKRTSDSIQTGINVLSGGLKQSNKEIYSIYLTKGFSRGSDNTKVDAFTYESIFEDKSGLMPRYRPYANIEFGGDRGTGKSRADWEARYRAANARLFGFTVQGWTQRNGEIWEPNTLVKVQDDVFDVDAEMLINACEYQQTSKGTITSMQICSPEKYKVKAQLDKIKTVNDTGYKAD